MKTHIALVHEEKKPFKCDICDYNCSLKIGDIQLFTFSNQNFQKLNVSELAETFYTSAKYKVILVAKVSARLEIFNFCSLKGSMNIHVASVHEGKKPFRCNICDYSCSQKSNMKSHITYVHEAIQLFWKE